MGSKHVKATIYLLNGGHDCVAEQAIVADKLQANGIGPNKDGLKRKELEDNLDISLSYTAKRVLDRLREIHLVERDPENFEDLRNYAIAPWRGVDGEIVNGEVDEAALEAIERLIEHMQDMDSGSGPSAAVADGGDTIREVLSREFDEPEPIEAVLRRGDLVSRLERAVDAIEEHPDLETLGDYDKMEFKNEAYRYRLTTEAVRLFKL